MGRLIGSCVWDASAVMTEGLYRSTWRALIGLRRLRVWFGPMETWKFQRWVTIDRAPKEVFKSTFLCKSYNLEFYLGIYRKVWSPDLLQLRRSAQARHRLLRRQCAQRKSKKDQILFIGKRRVARVGHKSVCLFGIPNRSAGPRGAKANCGREHRTHTCRRTNWHQDFRQMWRHIAKDLLTLSLLELVHLYDVL